MGMGEGFKRKASLDSDPKNRVVLETCEDAVLKANRTWVKYLLSAIGGTGVFLAAAIFWAGSMSSQFTEDIAHAGEKIEIHIENSGEKFEVLSETKSAHNTVTVISTLRKSNEETIDFNYKLREIKGKWRIVDIQISGISQLANTRAQFVSVIKDKGFDDLISRLQNKIKFLSEETAPVDNNG